MTNSSPAAATFVTADMARELAIAQKVCVRPLLRRVEDRQTGTEEIVAIPCGSTRESVCPSCAHKARSLRMQQCAEGWHRSDEPEAEARGAGLNDADRSAVLDADEDQDHHDPSAASNTTRRVRSTQRRHDAPDLPRVAMEDRTVGRVFCSPEGREYRPSMFLTVTLPSYGPVDEHGTPQDPDTYDYRRAALDAMYFPRLVDRLWQNLRRTSGYRVQYFAAVEPQRRLAPHLHAAVRGAIPRATLRQVVRATYLQLWWPAFDVPVYSDHELEWDGTDYVHRYSGEILPTWQEALDALDVDPHALPAHVLRFGRQLDIAGIIAPSQDADRAIRYLTKYLTKSVADAHTDDDAPQVARHVDRLHDELRYLPCSERCANWLRYGVQPKGAGPGLIPGRCPYPAHERENLGLGGRRVLVSRQWSGKTLTEHKAERAAVVREALLSVGLLAPEIERMAAGVTLADGSPRFVWTDTRPDLTVYARVILASIAERQRWREQYEAAKAAQHPVDSHSATPQPP